MDKESSILWLFAGYIYILRWYFCSCHPRLGDQNGKYEMHCLSVDVIDRYRKCDKVGATNEHVTGGCSSLLNPHISGDTTNWQK